MKHTNKLLEAIRSIAIIALVAVIGFSIAGCGEDDGDKKETVEVTANNSGEIEIQYNGGDVMTVKITTDLPAPNDSFTLNTEGESKKITGLTPGQKVTVTISFPGNYSNIDKSADGSVVYIQTYKN